MSAFRVALTFDAEHPDGPSEHAVQERLLERLDSERVRASFFLQGRWVEAYPVTARDVAAGGHLIGSHGFYHVRMPMLSATGFDQDVAAAERAICAELGVDPRPWFRLPFGEGAARSVLHRRLEILGYRHVHWHVSGHDWDRDATARAVEDAIVSGVLRHGDGAVVLLHTWPLAALGALDRIVSRIRDAGGRFVGLDELEAWPTGRA